MARFAHDALSPKVASGLTPIVNKAYNAGIPVIVLDRDLTNDQYTQFIGGDNRLIGRTAGEYAVQLLGGKDAAHGVVVEIWGGMAGALLGDPGVGVGVYQGGDLPGGEVREQQRAACTCAGPAADPGAARRSGRSMPRAGVGTYPRLRRQTRDR